tara:strand:+ start:915 stop:1715 length:801 start_codon:yes stop_codon:yes gene_type:complete
MNEGIYINDLEFSYSDLNVINGITTEIQSGEIISIVGPNGAGKTTLIKIIDGLIKPSRGGVWIHNREIHKLSSRNRSRLISYVPQNPRLPGNMKLIDFVLLGRNPHLSLAQWENEKDIRTAIAAMELTEVSHLGDRNLEEMSGGELQMGMLSLALTQESPIMLLDEPTSNLDLSHQAKIMSLIKKTHQTKNGVTILAIHDLTLAAQYTNRVILLSEGRIYADGTPSEVLTVENLSATYGANVVIIPHPSGGTPVVLPVIENYPSTT